MKTGELKQIRRQTNDSYREPVKAGGMLGLSAYNVLNDFCVPCPLQRVFLKIKILLMGGDRGVADTHELPEWLRKPSEDDEHLP